MRIRFDRSSHSELKSAPVKPRARRQPTEQPLAVASNIASSPAGCPPLAPLLIPVGEPLEAPRRLVVLVPDADTDEVALAAQAWAIASARGLSILYLTAGRDPYTACQATRRLAYLGAATRDDRVPVDTALVADSDWLPAIRAYWRAGDLVACHAEQRVRSWGLSRPLGQVLIGALNAPVCVLSGHYTEEQLAPSGSLVHQAAWIVPLLIIAGFFWLQVQIGQLPNGPLETILLMGSVLAETGLIWLSLNIALGPL